MEMRELPDVVAPTARTFLAIAGLLMVHDERPVSSPSFPAAKISKFSGFCAGNGRKGAKRVRFGSESGAIRTGGVSKCSH